MPETILDKPNVRQVWRFADVYCLLNGEVYAVFIIDRETGQQEIKGQTTLYPAEVWEYFWWAVNLRMKKRIADKPENHAAPGNAQGMSNVRGVWRFADVQCLLEGQEYRVFIVDRETDAREQQGEATSRPTEAWDHFWWAVNLRMKKRIADRLMKSIKSPWKVPSASGPYITNLQCELVNQEYCRRAMELYGRGDSPLTEERRIEFEVMMMDKYSDIYPIPPELAYLAKGLRIQLMGIERQKKNPR